MPINNTEKKFPRRKITFGEIKFDPNSIHNVIIGTVGEKFVR